MQVWLPGETARLMGSLTPTPGRRRISLASGAAFAPVLAGARRHSRFLPWRALGSCLSTHNAVSVRPFQICLWCWHRINESENGKCPACRACYDPKNYSFQAPNAQEYVNWSLPRFACATMHVSCPSSAAVRAFGGGA